MAKVETHRANRGFTLVELLVVIGIIGLLISILLPALGRARKAATTVKCAAQMHDLGSAMLLYANDFKGYLPAPRISTRYSVDNLTFDASAAEVPGSVVKENIKWWNLLGRRMTSSSTMAQLPNEMGLMRASVYWCPTFAGYSDGGNVSNVVGGINRNTTGYGMNWWPMFTPDDAGPFNSNGLPSGARQVERFSDPTGNNTSGSGPAQGRWYKLAQFRQPADRALLADARQFYLEARGVTSAASIPGQRLNYISSDYSNSTVGQQQTTYDFYRHGKYPGVADGTQTSGYFQSSGANVAYNILYCDGHVQTATDRETGYRACRQRFPN